MLVGRALPEAGVHAMTRRRSGERRDDQHRWIDRTCGGLDVGMVGSVTACAIAPAPSMRATSISFCAMSGRASTCPAVYDEGLARVEGCGDALTRKLFTDIDDMGADRSGRQRGLANTGKLACLTDVQREGDDLGLECRRKPSDGRQVLGCSRAGEHDAMRRSVSLCHAVCPSPVNRSKTLDERLARFASAAITSTVSSPATVRRPPAGAHRRSSRRAPAHDQARPQQHELLHAIDAQQVLGNRRCSIDSATLPFARPRDPAPDTPRRRRLSRGPARDVARERRLRDVEAPGPKAASELLLAAHGRTLDDVEDDRLGGGAFTVSGYIKVLTDYACG